MHTSVFSPTIVSPLQNILSYNLTREMKLFSHHLCFVLVFSKLFNSFEKVALVIYINSFENVALVIYT